MDHRSFRDQLLFSIGFAVSQSRHLLRPLLNEHAPDHARQQIAGRLVGYLGLSRFEIDETDQVLRRKTAGTLHRTPGE